MKVLDSTFLIDLLERPERIAAAARRLEGDRLATTRINFYEVLVGAFSLPDHERREKKLETAAALFERLDVLDLNGVSTVRAAQIAGMLNQQGKPIEASDCLIAGIALTHGATTIVTRNARHFTGIPGLAVETY